MGKTAAFIIGGFLLVSASAMAAKHPTKAATGPQALPAHTFIWGDIYQGEAPSDILKSLSGAKAEDGTLGLKDMKVKVSGVAQAAGADAQVLVYFKPNDTAEMVLLQGRADYYPLLAAKYGTPIRCERRDATTRECEWVANSISIDAITDSSMPFSSVSYERVDPGAL